MPTMGNHDAPNQVAAPMNVLTSTSAMKLPAMTIGNVSTPMVALNVFARMVTGRVVSTALILMSVLIVKPVMKMPLVPTLQVHIHANVVLALKSMAILA